MAMTPASPQVVFTAKILEKLAELIEEEGLQEDENTDWTAFIHAAATMAPTMLYNNLFADTAGEKTNLEFNHLANQLIFQYYRKDQ